MVNREVNYIISPTLGVLPEEVYDTIEDFARDVISIDAYVHDMRYKHGILIKGAATILAEYFDATKSGEDIYNDLQEIGFKETNALAAVKTLSVLDDVHRQLIDELCYNPDYAIHMMSLADKLKVADFDYNTYQKWYAISKEHIVYPIKTVYVDEIFEPTQFADVCPVPEDIPTEEDVLEDLMEVVPEVWRLFLVTYSVDCDTKTKDGVRLKRGIEFKAVAEAEASVVGEGLPAVNAIEDLLEEYAFDKGYDSIMEECNSYKQFGFDALEDQSDILVDKPKTRKTVIKLEVYDRDYGKTRFTDRIVVFGEWWLDTKELSNQRDAQVEKETRWS